jgi:hypothetical protein
MCIVGVSRGFLYLSGPPNLIFYCTYNMYIGIYIIYQVYMSEACDLAQLRCRATMACLICVAHGSHMCSQCIVIASLIDTPSRRRAPPKIDTQPTSADAG